MSRSGYRVRLENGLKLDLNRLARRGFVKRGAATGPVGICWTSSYWGEVASARIWADMSGERHGWLRIETGKLNQSLTLLAEPRHYGGRQWYFICPVTNRRASVVWKPPGASRFCCRQTWGRQVAYASQFFCSSDRLWQAKSKIKSRLIADLDPDEWEFPPKPKWMRWHTYRRHEHRFDRLEDKLDLEISGALARLLRSGISV